MCVVCCVLMREQKCYELWGTEVAIILEAVRVKRPLMSYFLLTSKSASASEMRLNLLSSGFIQVKQPNADRFYSAGDTSGSSSQSCLLLFPESHQPNHSDLNLPVRAAHRRWNSGTSGATHLNHDAFPAKPRGLPV